MIPKRSRFLLSMGSIAFLWLVLLGTVYFNDQVEFNAVESKWEIAEDYQIGTFTEISITETSINYDYSYTLTENEVWDWNEGDINTGFRWIRTNKIIVQENNIIFDNLEYEMNLVLYDINGNILEVLVSQESYDNGYSFWSSQTYFNDRVIPHNSKLNLPSNVHSFAINFIDTSLDNRYLPVVTYQQADSNTYQYEQIEIISGTSIVVQDSYQVFENIRNNATTVNPLGFMDTILSFPAQVAGYTRSVLSFFNTPTLDIEMSQQMEENINKWWWPRAIVPIIGGN